MGSKSDIPKNVVDTIQDIIARHKLNPQSRVVYNTGSKVGDGFLSKTAAVNIQSDEEQLHLFIKSPIDSKTLPMHKIYGNELLFYNTVYPKFTEFSKNVENGFRNAPKYYETSTKDTIVLENLRERGFTLFPKGKVMNHDHLLFVFKTFAKFHAISFAYKDQKPAEYGAIVGKVQQVFGDPNDRVSTLEETQRQMIKACIDQWDPVEDKNLLSRIEGLDIVDEMNSTFFKDEYSVLVKGDCWLNNMMFLYKDGNTETPTDIMLIDWQVPCVTSVVLDLSYFFYTIAPEEALVRLRYYLKQYHQELSHQIRLLGSDPNIVYPFEVLEKEWKRRCVYGYAVAFMIVKAMLMSSDEAPDFEELSEENVDGKAFFGPTNDEEYVKRMKILTEHMIGNDFLRRVEA